MATIRKRNGLFQAQVRLKGFVPRSASFPTKSKALAWASSEERRLLEGDTAAPKDVRQLRGMTLGDLAKSWYEAGGVTQTNLTGYRHLLADPVAQEFLTQITKKVAAQWQQRLLVTLKSDSVRRYARVPRGAWEYGLDVLELPIRGQNPFSKLGLKKVKHKRDRRLRVGEYDRLLKACDSMSCDTVTNRMALNINDIIIWAIETGMRRGEIAKIRQWHFGEGFRSLLIPETKTDNPRRIPLTKKAQEIARKRCNLGFVDKLFPYSPHWITRKFISAVRLAGLEDFRFHDLRHEALSRFNAMGLSSHDIKLISGHTSTQCLEIYIHSEVERVAELIGA